VSSTTTPVAKPSMLVCMAPDVATLQISELFTTTLGAFAVGTDLSVTTVELTVFVSALLTSVEIATTVMKANKKNSFNISNVFLLDVILS